MAGWAAFVLVVLFLFSPKDIGENLPNRTRNEKGQFNGIITK